MNTQERFQNCFIGQCVVNPAGPKEASASAAGPSTAGPSTAAFPMTAGPSAAGPSTAGPSTAAFPMTASAEPSGNLMEKLEREGVQNLKALQKETGYLIPHIDRLVNIMQAGVDEFKKETGRNMTYGEMRDLYG